MKISKNWELTILPVTKLVRTDFDWDVDNKDTKGSYYDYMKTDWWIESCKQAYAVRRIMFADCNKYHRCPDGHCSGRLNYEYSNMLQFCTECGTLVLPYKMKWVNPEHIKSFLKHDVPSKIDDALESVFWFFSDRFGYEETKKYFNPLERGRKRLERRYKRWERKNRKRKEYEDVSVNDLMDGGSND